MNDTVVESFRTAVGGFHKGDVTNYIARTAAEYDKKLKLKESENSFLRQKNELLESKLNEVERSAGDDQQEKEALQQENEALKEQLARLQEQLADRERFAAELYAATDAKPRIKEPGITDMELAAYRRAESAERIAVERAKRINSEVQTLFIDAVEDFDAADAKISSVIDALSAQLAAVQEVRDQLDRSRNDVQQEFETVCGREFFPLRKEEN